MCPNFFNRFTEAIAIAPPEYVTFPEEEQAFERELFEAAQALLPDDDEL